MKKLTFGQFAFLFFVGAVVVFICTGHPQAAETFGVVAFMWMLLGGTSE